MSNIRHLPTRQATSGNSMPSNVSRLDIIQMRRHMAHIAQERACDLADEYLATRMLTSTVDELLITQRIAREQIRQGYHWRIVCDSLLTTPPDAA